MDLADLGGSLKLLLLVALSGAIVFLFWLTLEQGADIARLGNQNPASAFATQPMEPAPEPSGPAFRQQQEASSLPRLARASGTVYKSVDAHGTITFSDHPMGDRAKPIHVNPITTYRTQDKEAAAPPTVSDPSPQAYPQAELPQPAPRVQSSISAADYTFYTKAYQNRHNAVVFSGRISPGPSCAALVVSLQAVSHPGQHASASTVVRDVGPGSRPFQVVSRRYYDGEKVWSHWNVTDIQVRCSD